MYYKIGMTPKCVVLWFATFFGLLRSRRDNQFVASISENIEIYYEV